MEHISNDDFRKVISGLSPIAASTTGPATAIKALQSNEYVATKEILPPSIDVITGAAVAVGIKTQIKTPS